MSAASGPDPEAPGPRRELERAATAVAALNVGYFAVELAVAIAIGSVSLFADSIDFLEDALLNALILVGLAWSARQRARLGLVLSALLLAPAIATLWTLWRHWGSGHVPDSVPLTATGAGAFAVNLSCALIMARVRDLQGSLTRAAFLSARNDVLANLAIIAAGLVTALAPSPWPDRAVGIGILVMNVGAAREVYTAACDEHRRAAAPP